MKRSVLALALVAALFAPLAAQSQSQVDLVNQIQTLLDQLRDSVTPALPPPPPPALTTQADLDAALSVAQSGDVITLGWQLIYPVALNITTPDLTIQVENLPAGRMDRFTPLPTFADGITVTASNVTLRGLEVRKANHLIDIVTVKGADVTLDRLRVLGDSTAGAKRGIAANSNGNLLIIRCFIDDTFQSYPGNDSQAIIAWDMAPGLIIEDNFLSGGSETIMIGGADPTSSARDPQNITIRGNTITKNPAWQTLLIGVKNTLELKNARNVIIEDNDISQSWGGHGQDGYLLALTVRNQSGTNPTATVQDVLIQHNAFSSGAAAVNILGTDNNHTAVKMARVQIVANTFSAMSPVIYTGAVKAILLGGGSQAVEIRDNVFANNANFSSAVYFYGALPANIHDGLIITGNILPRSTYGIFGEGSSTMVPTAVPGATSAFTRYTTNGLYSGNTLAPLP